MLHDEITRVFNFGIVHSANLPWRRSITLTIYIFEHPYCNQIKITWRIYLSIGYASLTPILWHIANCIFLTTPISDSDFITMARPAPTSMVLNDFSFLQIFSIRKHVSTSNFRILTWSCEETFRNSHPGAQGRVFERPSMPVT